MKNKRCSPNFIRTLYLALSLGLAVAGLSPFGSQSAQAATKTWGGGSTVDSNWTTGANWDANTAPVANDSLVFDQNVRLAAANNFTAATQFNGITFATSAGAFTLSGNSITLGGDIADNSLNAETISLALVLNATRSVDVASRMGFLTLGTGVISGATFGITKTGSGILTLSGANTFTGGVTINGGVISIASDGTGTAQQLGSGAAGAGTLTLNGGTLRTTASTQLSTNRGVTLGASGGTIDVNNAGTLTYNGVISGGANTFTKTGVGTLALGGVSTYTGNTYVNQGTLKLDFTGLVGTTTDIINSGSKLVLGGAPTTVNAASATGPGVTLNMTSKSAANSTQTFNGLQLGYGTATGGGALATISTTQTASGNNLLALGAITHNAGGTVNFSLAGTLSANNAITTTTGNTNDILGGWATYAGTSYAANDGAGNIVAYTGYTPQAAGAITSDGTKNYQQQTAGAVALSTANAATTDMNTLSISAAATGATTVTVGTAGTGSTGILRLGANGGLMTTGAGSLTIGNVANNGTLTAGGAADTAGEITLNGGTVNSKIADNGMGPVTVTINGGTLNGNNSYSGGTFVQGFTQLATSTTAFGIGAVTVLQGAQVYMNVAGTIANDFYIAGTGAAGSGDGVLRAEETLSGKITLIGDARIGPRNRGANFSGQITGGYALEFGSNIANGNVTLSNASGTNLNNWTGNTSINTVLILGSNTGDLLPDGSGKGNVNIVSSANTALDLNGKTETINGLSGGASVRNNATGTNVTFTLGNNDATASYGGTIVNNTSGTGTVAITKTGAGTQTLTGANTYTGGTTINAGTLALGNATNTLANAGAVNVNGGTLAIGANSDTVGAVTLTSGAITGSTGTLTGSSYDVQSGSVSAILGGSSVALTKSTSGTVTLTGANTYTGLTTVADGTLKVDNNGTSTFGKITGSNAANSIMVNTGGTLLMAGAGSTDRLANDAGVTLGGGILAVASGSSEGTAATVTGGMAMGSSAVGLGALTLSASSTLDFDVSGNGTLMVFTGFTPGTFTLNITNWSNANFDGAMNSGLAADDRLVFGTMLTAPQLAAINFGSGFTTTQISLGSGFYEIGVTPVPEPGTIATALGLFGLAGWRERRKGQLARQAERRAVC